MSSLLLSFLFRLRLTRVGEKNINQSEEYRICILINFFIWMYELCWSFCCFSDFASIQLVDALLFFVEVVCLFFYGLNLDQRSAPSFARDAVYIQQKLPSSFLSRCFLRLLPLPWLHVPTGFNFAAVNVVFGCEQN